MENEESKVFSTLSPIKWLTACMQVCTTSGDLNIRALTPGTLATRQAYDEIVRIDSVAFGFSEKRLRKMRAKVRSGVTTTSISRLLPVSQ